jgi:hypothetical protein
MHDSTSSKVHAVFDVDINMTNGILKIGVVENGVAGIHPPLEKMRSSTQQNEE